MSVTHFTLSPLTKAERTALAQLGEKVRAARAAESAARANLAEASRALAAAHVDLLAARVSTQEVFKEVAADPARHYTVRGPPSLPLFQTFSQVRAGEVYAALVEMAGGPDALTARGFKLEVENLSTICAEALVNGDFDAEEQRARTILRLAARNMSESSPAPRHCHAPSIAGLE